MVTAEIRTASRRKRRRLLLAVAVLTFAGLCVAAALAPSWETRTLPGDPAASQWFQSLGGGWLEPFMRSASRLGGALPMTLLLIAATLRPLNAASENIQPELATAPTIEVAVDEHSCEDHDEAALHPVLWTHGCGWTAYYHVGPGVKWFTCGGCWGSFYIIG